jgi:hypothetical protein
MASALYQQNRLGGYQVMVISGAQEAEDELVPVALITPLSQGRYPFVFMRLQSQSVGGVDLDAIGTSHGCVRL